jgi:hypothetical protein
LKKEKILGSLSYCYSYSHYFCINNDGSLSFDLKITTKQNYQNVLISQHLVYDLMKLIEDYNYTFTNSIVTLWENKKEDYPSNLIIDIQSLQRLLRKKGKLNSNYKNITSEELYLGTKILRNLPIQELVVILKKHGSSNSNTDLWFFARTLSYPEFYSAWHSYF